MFSLLLQHLFLMCASECRLAAAAFLSEFILRWSLILRLQPSLSHCLVHSPISDMMIHVRCHRWALTRDGKDFRDNDSVNELK
jgi:hypothetical protein